MKLNKAFTLTSVAIASAVLVACGGGGGGGGGGGNTGGGPTSTLNFQGSAAKGILIGAQVKVYEASDFSFSNPLALTEDVKTGTDGSFSFTLNTNKPGPFIIKVVADSNTTFIDELEFNRATSEFAQKPAPVGMELTTFVTKPADPAQPIVGMVNPYTHAAAAIIQERGYSEEAINFARRVATQLAGGVDPFSTKPIVSYADLSKPEFAESAKLFTNLVGLSKLAATCQDTTVSQLQCAINQVSDQAGKAVESGDLGKLDTFLAQQFNAAKEHIATDSAVYGAVSNVLPSTPPKMSDLNLTIPPVKDKPQVSDRAFFTELQNKFAEADSLMKVVDNSLIDKYGYLASVGTYTLVGQAYSFYNHCEISESAQIACNADQKTWTANGATATRQLSDNKKLTVTALGDVVEDGVNKRKLEIKGDRLDGKVSTSIDMEIAYKPVKNWTTNKNSEIEITRSVFTATENNKVATLIMSGKLQTIDDNVLSFDGESFLETPFGDKFTDGTIKSTLTINENRSEFKLDDFTFIADGDIRNVSGNPKLVVTGNYTPASFNNTTFDAFEVEAKLKTGTDTYILSTVRNQANEATVTAKFYNMVAKMKAVPENSGKYCVSLQEGEKLCADAFELASANGQFTFRNFNFDTYSASIYDGSEYIGSMTDGRINVNGLRFSIR